MNKFYWFLLLLIISLPAKAQRNSDYGVFAGISYYMGDINPKQFMYSPLPAGGVIYRYNFHPRYSLRTNIFFGLLEADDLDFSNDYQQNRASSFSGSVVEWGLQFEFNFLPYTTTGRWWDYTPYFSGGVALAFINTSEFTYVPVIPFSVGFKLNIYKNMGLELEYGFRKTFYDNFDGLIDNIDPDHYTWTHNNDWYMFTGLSLTWKMFHNLTSCPAYGDLVEKRKRPK